MINNRKKRQRRFRRYVTLAAFLFTGFCAAIYFIAEHGRKVKERQQSASIANIQTGDTLNNMIQQGAALPYAPPKEISTRQKPVNRAEKPVTYSAPPKKATTADEAGVCPTCKRFHLKSVTCASDAAFVSAVVKEPVKAVKKPVKATPAKKEKANGAALTFVRTWQAADNTPRAGRTVGAKKLGDIGQMSDLEREAASSEKMWRQLEEETQKIKNPPVWESGVLKFIKGQ